MPNNTYIDLQRAVISVSGADSYKFLQGIITNDLGKAKDNNAIYSYLLTPQGKYLFDFFISKKGDEFFIELAEKDKDEFLKKLKMYKLRSAVEVKDLSAELAVYAATDNSEGYADPRSSVMPNRVIKAKQKNAKAVEEYNKLRIENNIPEGDDLEKDKSYPLHFRMVELNGVDFKKGCYVGQEVTTRTHHRGEIRKTVYKISSATPLEKGSEIKNNDNSVGKVLTSIGNKALALLEKESAENTVSKLISGNSPITISH